jgi:hypothetical protein
LKKAKQGMTHVLTGVRANDNPQACTPAPMKHPARNDRLAVFVLAGIMMQE